MCKFYGRSAKGHKPFWYIRLENILLINQDGLRKVKDRFLMVFNENYKNNLIVDPLVVTNIGIDEDFELINKRLNYIEYLWSNNEDLKDRYILESIFLENFINRYNYADYSFYTDGALDNCTLNGGVAWIRVDIVNNEEIEKFFMNIKGEKSSTRLELLAIITVLLVMPPNNQLTIYTDSQAAVLKFNRFKRNFETKSERKLLNEEDLYLWKFILTFLKNNNIDMILLKVKAHDEDEWNNKVDKLAVKVKNNINENINLVLNLENLFNQEYYLWWNDYKIKGNIRKWVKELNYLYNKANWWILKKFYNLGKVYLDLIDWDGTYKFLRNEQSTKYTNQKDSNIRSYRIKNYFELLPINVLNYNHGDKFTSSKLCERCKFAEEDWYHIWECDKNNDILYNIISEKISEWIIDMESKHIKINKKFYRKEIFDKLLFRSPDGRSLILHDVIKGICTKHIIKNNLSKELKESLKNLINNIADSVRTNIWNIRNEQITHYSKYGSLFTKKKVKKDRIIIGNLDPNDVQLDNNRILQKK